MKRDSDLATGRGPTRREFLALGIGAFVVAAVPWAARRRARLVRRSVPAMGTIAELGIVHLDERYAHAALDAAIAELRRVESLMTRFRTTSDVGRVNLAAGSEAVHVSADTARVVGEALRWAEASGGAFDPSIGRIVALWDVGGRHEPPPADEIRDLAGRRFYTGVDLGSWRGRPSIRLEDGDGALDLGGVAKGYGVDRAVAVLRSWGVARGLVNVGGDLYALGTAPGGGAWRVGVRDPHEPGRVRETLEVEDAAVATSGDYAQYFMHRGTRYHHLLDPETAGPRRSDRRSLTVVAPDCMSADAAATAAFGMNGGTANALFRTVAPDARVVG